MPAGRTPEETVRRLLERFSVRDWDGTAELTHPDFEFDSALVAMIRGTPDKSIAGRGFAALRAWLEDIDDAIDGLAFETLELEAVGPAAVFELTRVRGVGRGSGIRVDQVIARIWEFEGELIRRMRSYLDPDEGRAAAAELEDAAGEVPGP